MSAVQSSEFLNPLALTLFFGLLAAAPFAALGMTSFLKLSVVFGILRNALGAGQLPSAGISSLLALALSLHIMSPVAQECWHAVETAVEKHSALRRPLDAKQTLEHLTGTLRAASAPLAEFLKRHSRDRELKFFSGTASGDPALTALIPAFILSELNEAFEIGFAIYLPFLVIDLIVANLLMGLGMMMLSPAAVSLPLKILLFVACDGWFLLSRNLMLGYA